jgi:sulfatase maturation enzyme AslB (radical SAM superfamily)
MEDEMKKVIEDTRDDWELHYDGDCPYDCPYCFDSEAEEEERVYDDEY